MENTNQILDIKIKPSVKFIFNVFYGIMLLLLILVLFMEYTEPQDIGSKIFAVMLLFYTISIFAGMYNLWDYNILIDNTHIRYKYHNTSYNIPLQDISKITFDIFELDAKERSNTKTFDIAHYSHWFVNKQYFVVFTSDGTIYKIVYFMNSRIIFDFFGGMTTFSKRKFKKNIQKIVEVNSFEVEINY